MNKMLSVLLVDDEKFAIANLSNLISTYCPSMKIIGSANNVTEAISLVNQNKPDVIFLDVNMPGQSGFELLNQLTYNPSVVFVTAHEQYALQAMKACAVDYLLKPIAIHELIHTQEKLLQIHTLTPEIRKNYSQVLRNLSSLMEKPGSIRKLTLHGNNGYAIFNIDDILYLAGEDNYTKFHFLNQKSVMVSKTLKDYEEILEPFGFMRIHKSSMVNLSHLKKIHRNESMEIIMADNTALPVSRRKATDLLDWSKAQSNSFNL